MTVRAAERESHFGGEPPEAGVALKVLATWVLSTTAVCSPSIKRCKRPVNRGVQAVWVGGIRWLWVEPRRRKNSPTVIRLGGVGPPLTRRSDTGVRRRPPLPIHLDQPTLVVAWVGINWHASAHKRCPVFRRRAPELSIVAEADDPYGLIQAARVILLGDLQR